jgi:hypothetical protein
MPFTYWTTSAGCIYSLQVPTHVGRQGGQVGVVGQPPGNDIVMSELFAWLPLPPQVDERDLHPFKPGKQNKTKKDQKKNGKEKKKPESPVLKVPCDHARLQMREM